jgi:DMSO/TMAO reductase YedYZ heme-binding membrane subunit
MSDRPSGRGGAGLPSDPATRPTARSMSTAERAVVNVLLVLCALISFALTVTAVAGITDSLRGNQMAPWILGRASGFTSYGLLVLLVLMGLVLSHPGSRRLSWPSRLARLRIHVSLAVFTLVFTVLHIVVLATDSFAGVGWAGVLVPMGSAYRPVGVTLGVVALWSGLVTGATAALAGRALGRAWWPIHKVSALILVLVWGHGFWTGIDTPAMEWFYLSTGALVLLVALSRYLAKTPSDRLAELISADAGTTVHEVGP